MKNEHFSTTVWTVTARLSALSGMMMGIGVQKDIDLDNDEIWAIGTMLADLRDELDKWNRVEENLNHSLVDAQCPQTLLSELLRRAKSHRKTQEIQTLILDALSEIQETGQHTEAA